MIVPQLKRLISALVIHPVGNLSSIPYFFFQRRAPDSALDLPFLFFQIVAVSIARERPRRLNLWLSGLAFGLLFYVYFYLWAMVAAGLVIALFLDRGGRKVYRWTLIIGFAIGVPQLLLSLYLRAMASTDAVARFGLFVPASRTSHFDFPILSVAIVIFAGIWIWKTGKYELIYPMSLLIAGILLGSSRLITGIYFHEEHFAWLWWPVRTIVALIVLVSIAEHWISRRPKSGVVFAAFSILYLASGIYLLAIEVTRTSFGIRQRDDFVRYRAQRMTPDVSPLVPRSVIAGSEPFSELAVVSENQRQLSGWSVPLSVPLDDSSLESRVALDAFLTGVERADFARQTSDDVHEYWFLEPLQSQLTEGFMRKFDEVTHDPDRFIRILEVRYIALPANQSATPYVKSRFHLVQPGPYWQIWQLQ